MRQVILIALGFILGYVLFSQIKGCASGEITISDTVHKSDTVWQKYDSIVVKKVKVKEVIYDTLPPEYIADPMYDSLKVQYEELAQDYLAKRIYADTLNIPQLKGLFVVNDTVKNNSLIGRSWSADYTIPVITNTTTITNTVKAPLKGQIYIGGGFASNRDLNNTGHLGILYKTKKDKIVGAYMAVLPGMQISYGVQSYWKLTFKK
jgi:hypothetical protein